MAEQVVKAPMRGRVIRVHVEKGSQVKEKDRMCDIEALKMEIPIMAPASGTIKEIYGLSRSGDRGGRAAVCHRVVDSELRCYRVQDVPVPVKWIGRG